MDVSFDRADQSVGNVLALEHVNTRVPDQGLATDFYISGMGFTRDPYMTVGTQNMWVNVGRQQFHLPTGQPQVLRGHVGVVVPDLDALAERLDSVRPRLAQTVFTFERFDGHVLVTQPWGNVLRCFAPDPALGPMPLGVAYAELSVPTGAADGIARFYTQGLLAPATLEQRGDEQCACVAVGPWQWLVFRESAAPEAPYDGHHIAIYLSDFGHPYQWLFERGLVTEESNLFQYRFKDLVDPDTGRVLFTLEHEVRSVRHPLFQRPLVNRNPAQSQARYVPGRDAFYP